jgi:hypothetical protein
MGLEQITILIQWEPGGTDAPDLQLSRNVTRTVPVGDGNGYHSPPPHTSFYGSIYPSHVLHHHRPSTLHAQPFPGPSQIPKYLVLLLPIRPS